MLFLHTSQAVLKATCCKSEFAFSKEFTTCSTLIFLQYVSERKSFYHIKVKQAAIKEQMDKVCASDVLLPSPGWWLLRVLLPTVVDLLSLLNTQSPYQHSKHTLFASRVIFMWLGISITAPFCFLNSGTRDEWEYMWASTACYAASSLYCSRFPSHTHSLNLFLEWKARFKSVTGSIINDEHQEGRVFHEYREIILLQSMKRDSRPISS